MPANVHFILGRSGAGKTRAVTKALQHAVSRGERAVLIVPEQFTYETERTLARAMGGLLGVQVLSFTRLTERVLANDTRTYLSRQGRRMLLRRAAYRLQDELEAFAPVAHLPGFAIKMDGLIALCKRFQLAPEDLQRAAAELPEGQAFAKKLRDIAKLYEVVEQEQQSRFLDAEDAMTALVSAMPHSALSGATVFVDGFDILTAQLYDILDALLAAARDVTFCICMDANEAAKDRLLFLPEERVYNRLFAMATAQGCPADVTRLAMPAGVRTPALAFLEQSQFAWPVPVYGEAADDICITGASDRTAEVEAMADEICALVRGGMRYREIAVMTGDMPGYLDLIRRAFLRRGIPLFADIQRPFRGHPVAELMLCAVRAASRGLPAGETLRVAKTGLAGVSMDECEQLENYLLRYGLRGGRQLEAPFCRGDVPPEAESGRAALLPPLLRLREGLLLPTAAEKTAALYAYLEELQVFPQLAAIAEGLEEESLIQEYAQAAGVTTELLEQLYAILRDTRMTAAEYTAILEEAVLGYQIGAIPATSDQVLLGTLTRSRSRYVRALFVMGANEGVLPAAHSDEEIIDDKELDMLTSLGLAPWGNSEQRAENDRLDLYRALSKATERLYVYYAYASGSKELYPSSLVTKLTALFPCCGRRTVLASGDADTPLPQNAKSGLQAYARELRKKTPGALLPALEEYFRSDAALSEAAANIKAFSTAPAVQPVFPAAFARRLYGDSGATTVSRLEQFNRCPFSHFMRYGLEAYPRREFGEQNTDVGKFCHMVLERFVSAVIARGNDWNALDGAQIDAILDELYPDCAAGYENGLYLESKRMQCLMSFWMDRARVTAHAVAAQIQAGAYKPVCTERRFGADESAPALTLTLPDGRSISLTGVIDRIDIEDAQTGNQRLRIVDYKTGGAALQLPAILDGTKLQLPLYLAAAKAMYPNTVPGGLFYQPVDEPVLDALEDENTLALEQQKALRLSGYMPQEEGAIRACERELSGYSQVVESLRVLKDGDYKGKLLTQQEMDALLECAKNRAADTLTAVLAGNTAAAPLEGGAASPCTYCDYRSVCRFDAALQGCGTRKASDITDEDFLRMLGGGEAQA